MTSESFEPPCRQQPSPPAPLPIWERGAAERRGEGYSQDKKLQELMGAIENINPQPADYWQVTAIIESLGYTDRAIQKEFGFADALTLGQYIYELYKSSHTPITIKPPSIYSRKAIEEVWIFIAQFSRSFVYAGPLLVILFLEYFNLGSTTKLLPPELSSLFTLATMASLSTSGGFVQMISRRGEFYLNLGERVQAKRVCISLLGVGTTTSILLALIGLWFGFYRGFFADEYLILAAFYYLLLSVFWMLLATLTIQLRRSTPLVLLGISALFLLLRVVFSLGALEAQILSIFIALVVVAGLVAIAFRQGKTEDTDSAQVKQPRLSALIYLLAPYFCYGTAYFCFIFADRIVAGFAIEPASGLIFAVNSQYQRGMDLALLNFLLLVPLVEYLAYKSINYWYAQTKNLIPSNLSVFSHKLRQRYWLTIAVTVLAFGLSVALTVGYLKPPSWGTAETSQAFVGSLGYLFFVIGLLNSILLFSLNQPATVLKSLLPALVLNLAVGYILAHLFTVFYAAIGLVVGATVFMLLSSKKVLSAIAQLDYAYYLGGY